MPVRSRKKRWHDLVYSKTTLGIVLGLCLLLGWSLIDRYNIMQDMAGRRSSLEHERDTLMARKDALQEKVDYLSNDRGVEAEIRKHFDVAKEGEQVVVLVDQPSAASNTTTGGEVRPPESGFWSSLIPW